MNSPDSKRAHFYGHAAPTPPAPPLPPPPLTLSYAPLLVSARREGEAGRGKGEREEGREEGEKDCERGGVGSERAELQERISCKSQAAVRGGERAARASAIIDRAASNEHERKMRVSFISGDHNWREKCVIPRYTA